MVFNRLYNENNNYYITSKMKFENNGILSEQDIIECLDFAYNMTFATKGEHRNHRSGGQARRKKGEIFVDTFQGKLAEFAFYNYCKKLKWNISYPDMSIMTLNKWDGCDFKLNGKQIAIKSTKYFGNLLLLETKDWDQQGNYKPNYGTGHEFYDLFVLIRIKPEVTSIMKRKRWLYSDNVPYNELFDVILNEKWECNVAGFISHDELVSIINYGYILPQHAMLNGKIQMDAENYYIQLGDMHGIWELNNLI